MKKLALINVFFFSMLLQAQVQIQGTVINSVNKEVLSFVNIGIKHKNIGVTSSYLGSFSILIPETLVDDTLTFSIVGYYELHIPINQIDVTKQSSFLLKAKPVQLNQVDIVTKKLVEHKYGIKKTHPKLSFIDASINHNDIFEIAQVIKLSSKPSKITSVNLLINQSYTDSGIFRINFYAFDGFKPTQRLVEINMTQKILVKTGWLKFDLKNDNIYLKGEVAVAIEFIPSVKYNKPISYEIKLGGNSRSFVRTSSLGEWNTPPHHYRMFVTSLETDEQKNVDNDMDEKETLPLTHIYSKEVKDTFSLFVNLPEGYHKHSSKKYPTLFLLDANVYYDIITNSISRLNSNHKLIEPIVIGIGYKGVLECDSLRDRDYTFPKALPTDSFLISGGADKFLAFIEKELIPYIDKNYRTDTADRNLMGHSLGGYFSLFALLKQQQDGSRLFKTYISASPSLEYANHYLFSQFKDVAISTSCSLLLTIGAMEDGGVDFNAFTKLLKEDKFKNITTTKVIFPKMDHMGTAIPSFDRGLDMMMKP